VSGLLPIAASTEGAKVDVLFYILLALAGFITLLVFGLVLLFAIRYRRGSKASRAEMPDLLSREVEIGWTIATLFLFLFVFWWAGSADLSALVPPKGAIDVHVLAKQWMWKVEHSNGAREINELHVPINQPVRLIMQSQDVIHSFFVPAFRMKQDVVPGRDNQTWFQATKLGTFHLLCAEYCGTDHSVMRGRIVVMRLEEYAAWLARQPEGDDLAHQGAALFVSRGCSGCHAASSNVHAPKLAGIYGRSVQLSDGRTIVADDAYVRDSILQPKRDIVAGYEPIMPSYAGILDAGEVQSLVAYIRAQGTSAGDDK
jgi:cytochrome c oxidase subunit 2